MPRLIIISFLNIHSKVILLLHGSRENRADNSYPPMVHVFSLSFKIINKNNIFYLIY